MSMTIPEKPLTLRELPRSATPKSRRVTPDERQSFICNNLRNGRCWIRTSDLLLVSPPVTDRSDWTTEDSMQVTAACLLDALDRSARALSSNVQSEFPRIVTPDLSDRLSRSGDR